jgi:Ca-activated chloride channel family protein
MRSIKPSGGTSLYEAIDLAAQNLSPMKGRKVILLITDGDDTTSKISLKDCLKTTQNSGAVIYTLVVQPIKSEAGENLAGKHAMIYLSEKTGGRYYLVTSAESVQSSFAAISDELRTQYLLGYYPKPSKPDDGFHKIEIRVSNPLFLVRAREGYYSKK